jgi:MscS family membrane protein
VVDIAARFFAERAKRTAGRFDDMVVPLLSSVTKIVAVVAGLVAVVAAFSVELPYSLLGGLGIGGIAIALASQETLSNFFGSITVLLDRPFEVGDLVTVDGVEGEVEAVGFRSTRLRTGVNSQVTLPNSKLAAASIDNLGRRRYRRLRTTLSLDFDTSPERIDAFCEGVRELVRRHPHTRKDFYVCSLNDLAASSLDVLLVVYFEAPDWPTELRERHRLLTDILRLARDLDVVFAFPTQTVHMFRGQEPPPPREPQDPERAGQSAAARIAGELPNYQDRPGRVKFMGPTPIDSA